MIHIQRIQNCFKLTCLSRSAEVLLSKSIACFAFMSGFSLIFSMMNVRTAIIASTLPVIRQTLSDVPSKVKPNFKMHHVTFNNSVVETPYPPKFSSALHQI